MIDYLVTTDIKRIEDAINSNPDTQIAMLDGTVPGWTPRNGDIHFDHHRDNGVDVQIREMIHVPQLRDDVLIVTTQVDADAICAAAFLQNPEISIANFEKLEAISYCCDHLAVPERLSHLYEFGEKVVAAQKQFSNSLVSELALNPDKKQWTKEDKEAFASASYKASTEIIIDALNGKCLFPGENGEADNYLEDIKKGAQNFKESKKILSYRNVLIFNCCEVEDYLDPRIPLLAVKDIAEIKLPFTLTQRLIVNKGELLGYSYTLGVVPLHSQIAKVDYVKNEIFQKLTAAELAFDSHHFDASIKAAGKWEEYQHMLDKLVHFNECFIADWLCSSKLGWGGRKTVGGSSWNTPSKLSPMQIVDIMLG